MKAFFIALLLFTGPLIQQETLYEGEWEAESRRTTFKGSWKIVKDDGQYKVELGADFEARKAPDLKIFLSKAPLTEISGKNATTEGSAVLVAKLTSYKGKASYVIPSGINVNEYTTIIIHCEEYSKLWGGSALK